MASDPNILHGSWNVSTDENRLDTCELWARASTEMFGDGRNAVVVVGNHSYRGKKEWMRCRYSCTGLGLGYILGRRKHDY